MTRYEREIVEIIDQYAAAEASLQLRKTDQDAALEARADEQRARWAAAQNLGRQQAIAQNQANFEHSTRGVGVTAARARRGEVLGSSPDLPFIPLDPAPVVPRNHRDYVRVLCYAGCALLLGVLAVNAVRWLL